MMFWDSYYWGKYGNLHTTPQAACANQNWAGGGTEYTFVYSPEAGYGPYWCEPYINGVPYPPGTPSSIRYNAGKWIKQTYTCFDPITRTYDPNWRQASKTQWENQCAELPKATANACPVGNPVSPLTGQKTQSEPPDFQSNGPHPLVFQRTYRSDAFQNLVMGSISNAWFHNWQRLLNLQVNNSTPMIIARRGDGASFVFVPDGQQWKSSNGQTRDSIIPGPNEKGIGAWQYHVAETDATEAYDAYGRLLTVTERNGWSTTLTYSTIATSDAPGGAVGLLMSVRNHFGVELKFSYDASNSLVALLTPDGKTIRYGIDGNNNPMVVWPDQTERHYNFGEDISGFKSALPGRLTGITDELGVRYSRYNYNTSTGSVTSEEHAGGVDKLTFSYGTNATLVTDGNALTRSFNYQLSGKLRQPTGASGSSPIGDPFNTIQYDTGNNVIRTVDRNGSDTRYSYDSLGRETQRIEGYGTADAKTTTTEWHPTWNLPLKIAAPSRVDYFSYDANGQVLTYSWYSTSDANGSQGLNAQPSGDVTSTSWTYDANGLVATAVDKVGDTVTGQWTFTYDAQGNLASVTNMAGQIGTAVQYDAAGRLLEAVDVSGSRIKYAYDARGRMTDFDIDGIHTKYEYDAVGQLVSIAGPYDLATRYTYDAAHRLIQILDNITIPEVPNESSLVSPFAVDGATSPSSLASVSHRLASSWNAVLQWLKDWLSGIISSANAQMAPSLPNSYAPPVRPGQSIPAYPGSSAAPDLDPSLTREKATPGLYVLKFLVKVQQACGQALSQVVDKVFNKSEPPGDCGWNKYTQLRDSVEAECKDVGAFSCRTSDTRDLLQYKRAQALRCAMARTRIMRTCFRGGDEEHEIPERNAWRAVAKCDSYLAQP
ncbi:DUF6531 domain-containing protein [Cupriavidus pauculus]|uniref:DUF6531 domain-containing protein n=1 Tax=Cupriavidus pauculus TaxID=82633 RepID=UPI001D0C8D02|nr:DUF6531 domain-containing protein [Cupriavidus pauculus]